MNSSEKVKEYIQRAENIRVSDVYLTEKEAAIHLWCSIKTLRRWAKKMNIKPVCIGNIRSYALHQVEKIKLRREYAKHINKFKKSSKK